MGRNLKFAITVFCCLLVLNLIGSGQSGRKQKKADPAPPVQGVNQPDARVQPEPQLIPEKPKEEERRSIMVMSGMPEATIPLYYADAARQGCLSEMRERLKTVDVREARNQNRSDAIKAAKDDNRTYVILIDIEADRMGTSASGVEIRYSLFEPKTGKVIGTGFGSPVRPSGGTTLPPIGGSSEQVYLDWSGRDIAKQVMKKLGLGLTI